MPVITTYTTIYASFIKVNGTAPTPTLTSAPASSPSVNTTPLLLSTPNTDEKDRLPTIIAIVVGILGALVISIAIFIVTRSRLRVRKAESQFNENRRALTNVTNAPQQPAPRLKPLSFLQGREGPKEWIPGGTGSKRSGGSMKRSSKRTLSLRKSFLSRVSRMSRITLTPSTPHNDASSNGHGTAGLVGSGGLNSSAVELSSMQGTSTAAATPKYSPQPSIEQFEVNSTRTDLNASIPPRRTAPTETTVKFERGVRAEEGVEASSTAALIKALNIGSPQPAAKVAMSTTAKNGSASLEVEPGVVSRDSKRISRPISTYQMWLAIAENEEEEARASSAKPAPAPISYARSTKEFKPKADLVKAVPAPTQKSKPTATDPPSIAPIWFDDDDGDDVFSIPKRTIRPI